MCPHGLEAFGCIIDLSPALGLLPQELGQKSLGLGLFCGVWLYASCMSLLNSSRVVGLTLSFTTSFRACMSFRSMARST